VASCAHAIRNFAASAGHASADAKTVAAASPINCLNLLFILSSHSLRFHFKSNIVCRHFTALSRLWR
jgi:hypothetical protein